MVDTDTAVVGQLSIGTSAGKEKLAAAAIGGVSFCCLVVTHCMLSATRYHVKGWRLVGAVGGSSVGTAVRTFCAARCLRVCWYEYYVMGAGKIPPAVSPNDMVDVSCCVVYPNV